jgi:outer membrane protein
LGGRERYSANPAVIGIYQPIFAFNPLRWDKKIEPLRYEESKREYFEEMEQISAIATQRFFNLLLAQISYEIAEKNVANNDTLYQIAQGRYNLGKIAENELLQLELSTMNARQELAQAALDMETSALRLKVFLGLTDNDPIRLEEPGLIPQFAVEEEKALQEARKNRSRVLAFNRELLQAERELAQARGESGLNVEIFGTFGLTQRANDLSDLYINPDDQQRLRVGFNIPLVDWGRTKSRIGTAKANQELVRADIEQEQINFDQDVYLAVKQFKMLRNQLLIAQKAVEVGEKRFEITKSRYLIGKVGILDLNIATQERDMARKSYVASLRSFWEAYYNLRLLTLYDFEQDTVLLQEL